MAFGEKTTAVEVATAFKDQIKGKNVVITGVSPNALGAAMVEALAPYAKTLILASRSIPRVEEAIASTRTAVPSADIRIAALDLTSGASIRRAGETILSYNLPIHVLINNAAVPIHEELKRTEEGFESQIGGDHFGHFLFTSLLFPAIKKAAEEGEKSRIVNLTSLAATFGGVSRFEDINYKLHPEEYNKYKAYTSTKTANNLFTVELSKRYKDAGILAFSAHPGVIRGTTLGGSITTEDFQSWGLISADGTPVMYFKEIPEGASTALVAAFDPSIESKSGSLLSDAAVFENPLPEFYISPDAAAKLWAISEEAWGIKFAA